MTTASPSFSFAGVATPLAKKTVAATTSFSAALDDITGISTVEWSVIATDETSDTSDYTLVTSGIKGSIVTLTSLGLGTAAILQAVANGGIDPQTGQYSPAMTATALFEVLLANGGSVGVVNETTQRDGVFGSLVFLNQMARALDSAITVAGSVTSVTGTAPIAVGGTATDPVIAIPAASGATAGSMSSAHYTLLAGATSAATPSTLAERDNTGSTVFANVTAANVDTEAIAVGGGGTGSAVFSCAVSQRPATDTYAATITMRGIDGGQHNVTLTGNVAFAAPTNYSNSPSLRVFVRQGGAGSYTAAWASGAGGFFFPVGLSGTLLATAVNDIDMFEFVHSTLPSSHWVCTSHLQYTPP